jgi:hypothetical protein
MSRPISFFIVVVISTLAACSQDVTAPSAAPSSDLNAVVATTSIATEPRTDVFTASSTCYTRKETAQVEHSSAGSNIDATLTLSATICVSGGKIASVSKTLTHTTPGSNVVYVTGTSTVSQNSSHLIADFAGSGTFKLVRNNRTDCKETISDHIVGTVQSGGNVTWSSSSRDAVFINVAKLGMCYHT